MFNELSLSKVNSVLIARNVLETFVRSSIRAKEVGFTEIRLHEKIMQNLYQLSLLEGYRIDNWLNDKEVNFDLRDKFKEIISTYPLITTEEISEGELFEMSEFHITLDEKRSQVFGLGAAYVYGTLAASLSTHTEWLKSSVTIQHYSLDHEGNENTSNVEVLHFSSNELLDAHIDWIENEQRESLEKSIELWNKRVELFPNILLGTDLESQLQSVGMMKSFNQIFACLKKLNAYAGTWTEGGFDLNELKAQTGMDISGESASTMQKYSVQRKFRSSTGLKVQFELHIKLGSLRIYILPNDGTHQITVGYIGKHLRTAKFD